ALPPGIPMKGSAMKSPSAERYRKAYEDERVKAAEAAALAKAEREAREKRLGEERAAVPALERRIAERLASAKLVDKRIQPQARKAQPNVRHHGLRAGSATAIAFTVDSRPGRPVVVQAAVAAGKGRAPEVKFAGPPA